MRIVEKWLFAQLGEEGSKKNAEARWPSLQTTRRPFNTPRRVGGRTGGVAQRKRGCGPLGEQGRADKTSRQGRKKI